ncbi:Ig-like domain-containing protein [Pedobacter borealis]|uniref:Ig-like domain-containing protein n=1 Tax=Pedobacter borealis TaxID=475254 RepID=UPI000493032E|nr:Ig-like domain-containing protein [Pedobacter borealis]
MKKFYFTSLQNLFCSSISGWQKYCRHYSLLVCLTFLFANSISAQITTADVDYVNWSKIENTTPPTVVTTDADNGDGANDGAMLLKGTANTPALQGLQCLLTGSPLTGEQIDLEAKYYQASTSYLTFKIQIYNVTDNIILAQTANITVLGTATVPASGTLSYTFTAASAGDQIAIRFVRADDLNPVRQIAIDYLKVNGQFINMRRLCRPVFNFDLPLTTAATAELNDLNTIRTNLSNQLLGTTAPSATALNNAVTQYNALNITVVGTNISGNAITSTNQIGFLKTFAQRLKFNPADTSISNKAVKAVWYLSSLNCSPKTNSNLTFYNYPTFARTVIFLNNYLPDNVKALFGNTLYNETSLFRHFFDANYDFNTTLTNGAVSTDIMYLHLDILFAYADWFKTDDEKIRYLKTVKRYLDRFLTYSGNTAEGLKKDGLSYHHNNSYDGYMYAFSTVANVIKSLEGTGFQIDQSSYLRFRDAIYAQTIYSNDAGVIPYSMIGRNPTIRNTTLSQGTLSNIAISGGKILGLSGADPVLAGIYNRKYGVNSQFNNSTITPFEEGYIQFNYGNFGIYRKNNWVASMRGQSNQLWGAEIYAAENRFGRYQGYGSLEIVYPGNAATGTGYDMFGWDWNYNPGTTTIVLPWSKLHGEKESIEEKNTYGFAGSLALNQANKSVLSKTFGQSGLFGMKFKERTDLGWGASFGTNTHNGTFEFTKAYFAIDDIIVCLGSGIKNNDAVNPTVTTLFQRLNNNTADVWVNGEAKTNQNTESFAGTSANWIIDNYNTGYYVLPNSGTLKIRNSNQITPYETQVAPSEATIAGNTGNNYHLAYLDHGTAPVNNSYEFVCIPAANTTQMTAFAQQMQSVQNKPYVVYQNTVNQQIIEHKASKTWAYALPAANAAINDGLVKANDMPCLVLYKGLNENSSEIVLSVCNPDMGAAPSTPKVITLTLNGKWNVSQANPDANVASATDTTTTISFKLADGFPVELKLVAAKPPIVSFTSPVANANFNAPATITLSANASDSDGSVSKVEFFQGTNKLGEATAAPYNFDWANVAAGSYTLRAKATDDSGMVTTSDSVKVNVNALPTIAITSPIAAAGYNAPANINIAADAADADGTIVKVEFFHGETKIGESTTAPYVFDWTNVVAGKHALTAKAIDNSGAASTSAVVNITVNAAPTVAITSPVAGANNNAPANILITVNAADTDGTIAKIEFFEGTNKLGESTVSPYSFNWNNVSAGTYALTAKATDDHGTVTTSTVVNTTVVCPPIAVTIPDVYAMNAAVDNKNTLYLGYGPSSLTLTAMVQGSENYSCSWNTGEQTPSISISQAGTYTLTVTYAGGCQTTASITIGILDVRCGNNNDKVKICHNDNVICVAPSAVQEHLDHGDKLGSCNNSAKDGTNGNTVASGSKEMADISNVKLYPNPVRDNLNITVTRLENNANIRIYNVLGTKVRDVHFNSLPQLVPVESLPTGTYYVVIQNGKETFKKVIIKY